MLTRLRTYESHDLGMRERSMVGHNEWSDAIVRKQKTDR